MMIGEFNFRWNKWFYNTVYNNKDVLGIELNVDEYNTMISNGFKVEINPSICLSSIGKLTIVKLKIKVICPEKEFKIYTSLGQKKLFRFLESRLLCFVKSGQSTIQNGNTRIPLIELSENSIEKLVNFLKIKKTEYSKSNVQQSSEQDEFPKVFFEIKLSKKEFEVIDEYLQEGS